MAQPSEIAAASCANAADPPDRGQHAVVSAPARPRLPSGVMPAIDEHGGWASIVAALTAGRDLGSDEAAAAMSTILAGDASDAQIAGFVVGLITFSTAKSFQEDKKAYINGLTSMR